MKKFLRVSLIYVIVIGIITVIINILYKDGNTGAEWEKFKYVPESIEICNLGSSHGVHGYYYEDLEKNHVCFNMALDSQSLSYDRRVLEVYQDRIRPGGVVIVDISYFSCWGIPETQGDRFESKNKRYYNILPKEFIKEYDLYTDIMTHWLPALNAGPGSIISTIIMPKWNGKSIRSYPEVDSETDITKLKEDVEVSCQRHIFSNKRDENGELFYNDEEIQALKDIVQICRQNKIIPIFVTVPYLKEYTDEIGKEDPDFYQIFYELINSMSEELSVEYFDYSLDDRFIFRYDFFYNGDHMNSIGAREFTNTLYEEVIKDRLEK